MDNQEQMTAVLGTVAMEPKGEYSATTYYEKLNTVEYNGSTYMAKEAVQGENPSTSEKWQFIAGGLRVEDIVDNTNSTATNKALSAKQGKTLNDNFENSLESNYYEEIIVKKERYYDTDCYITTIPMNDENGNQINPYVAYGNGKTPTEYARENYTTLTINASAGLRTSNNELKNPSVIANGEIIRDYDMTNLGVSTYAKFIGIKSDRSVVDYPIYNTTAQQMLNDGVIQAFHCYFKLVENGSAVDLTDVTYGDGSSATANQSPRQSFGIKNDGTIIIISCDGRTDANAGLYNTELQQLLINKGCVEAWNLDGGGSTSTTYKGLKINRNIDNNGTSDRMISYTLNFKADIKNEENAKTYSDIGKLKQQMLQQIIPDTLQNKIRTLIVIDGYDIQNRYSEAQDYYPIAYDRVIGNTYSTELIELIRIDENDTKYCKFKIKKKGYFTIKVCVELLTRHIGMHRLNTYRENMNYQIPGSEIGVSSTLASAQRVELVTTTFINNLREDNIYILRLETDYANTGIVSGGSIMIEEVS